MSSGDVLLLLDTHKRTVYCSGQDNRQVQTGDMTEKILENRKMSDAGHDREQYLVSHGGKTGFYFLLCRQAPMSQPAVQTMWTVSLCLSALGLFLCLAVSGVLTGSIARPVQTLDEAMEKVKKGDLSIRIHPQSNDEMGRLTSSFNQMTEDLGRYLEDKVQRQKDLNETKLKLYQTQLNPHFLYNTLDTINWEARIRQMPRIAVLAEKLAACATLIPGATSLYYWEGKLEQEYEVQMILKTTVSHQQALLECLKSHHPYQTPELLVLPVTHGDTDYF
mgnify:CR=1 FL=1